MGFILKDISYASFASPGEQAKYSGKDAEAFEKFSDVGKPAWSFALARSGTNQNTVLNPTGPPGFCLNIYMSLVFDLPKDGWKVIKVDENMDVTPVHHQYYELTHGRKDALEVKIREGLVKIGQSIADLELVRHDLLKYEDFEEQLLNAQKSIDPKASAEEKNSHKMEKRKAELALRTVFMEEVDYHAGGGGAQGAGRLSMAFLRNHNIMPTIVDDFFRMTKKEDLEKDSMLKDLPKVEKRMLEVKWDAYQDWLKYFESNVKRRMSDLKSIEKSREKSLDEYRNWLKPTIARYKMIVDSLENEGARKGLLTASVRLNAVATALHNVTLWFFKSFVPPDPHRAPGELFEKAGVVAFGKWEKENLYLHPEHGLITDHPWMTEKWILGKAGIKYWGDVSSGIVNESEWYYSFQQLNFSRMNFKTSATGSEGEDAEFKFVNYMMSKNIVAAKVIEHMAMQESLEIYIDDILGLPHEVEGKPIIVYSYDKKAKIYRIDMGRLNRTKQFRFKTDEKTIDSKDFPGEVSFKSKKELEKKYPKKLFMCLEKKAPSQAMTDLKQILGLEKVRFFLGRGPYEQNWSERIKKYYLKPNSARFEYVRNFIIKRMNVDI